MLKEISSYEKIYIMCGVTDMRKSVDGLAAIVQLDCNVDPFINGIFLFCNRNRNRLKALSWDNNGFVLAYKRLDSQGAKFQWPMAFQELRAISSEQLQRLLNGFPIETPKGFEPLSARDFC